MLKKRGKSFFINSPTGLFFYALKYKPKEGYEW